MHLVNYLVALLIIYDTVLIHHKWKLIELSCHVLDCFLIIRCEGNKQNKLINTYKYAMNLKRHRVGYPL